MTDTPLPVGEDEKLPELKHGMNCGAWHNTHGHEVNSEDCTCGLRYRIQEQTEKTMHAAWRKRAEETELERDAGLKEIAELKSRVDREYTMVEKVKADRDRHACNAVELMRRAEAAESSLTAAEKEIERLHKAFAESIEARSKGL